jgi:hypothetical protein
LELRAGTGSEKPTSCKRFYGCRKPEVIIDAAAKVGGILANNDFRISLLWKMQIKIIDTALQSGVEKFIFLEVLASIQNWRHNR